MFKKLGAIDAISNVVSVARESRSELAVISTMTRSAENMEKDLASKGLDLRAACRTSCALLAKSVVDASMQSQNTQEVLTKLQNELPPKDLEIIVDWFESYTEEFQRIGMVRYSMIQKYEHTKLTADVPHTVYGIEIIRLQPIRRRRRPPTHRQPHRQRPHQSRKKVSYHLAQ